MLDLRLALLGRIARGANFRPRQAGLLFALRGSDAFDYCTEIVRKRKALEFGVGLLADILQVIAFVFKLCLLATFRFRPRGFVRPLCTFFATARWL